MVGSSRRRGKRLASSSQKLRSPPGVVVGLPKRSAEFDQANRKFFALMGREEVLEEQSGQLDDVVHAVLAQRTVEIHYRDFGGKAKQLRVNPYSLVVYDSHLYVVGSDATNGTPKPVHPFRFARIRKLHVTKQRFDYPSPAEYDPKSAFRDSIGVWLSDEPAPVRSRSDCSRQASVIRGRSVDLVPKRARCPKRAGDAAQGGPPLVLARSNASRADATRWDAGNSSAAHDRTKLNFGFTFVRPRCHVCSQRSPLSDGRLPDTFRNRAGESGRSALHGGERSLDLRPRDA